MPRPVEVPEVKVETRVVAKPMPKYVQLEPPAKVARNPGPKQPQGPPPGAGPRGSVALGSGKSSPCSFTQNLLLGDQGQPQMSQQLGMQLIHTMVRLTNAIDTLSGEMRRTREASQPTTPLATLPPPPITTAAQRRRYEEQLEGQQRKERRTYERADQYDQYDDNNDTWEKGESSDRHGDRDGQDDDWGEWYYRKDWKRRGFFQRLPCFCKPEWLHDGPCQEAVRKLDANSHRSASLNKSPPMQALERKIAGMHVAAGLRHVVCMFVFWQFYMLCSLWLARLHVCYHTFVSCNWCRKLDVNMLSLWLE